MNKQSYIGTLTNLLDKVMDTIKAGAQDFVSRAGPTDETYDKALTAFTFICRYAEHLCDKIYKEGQEDA